MAALHRTVVHTRWAGSTGTDARLDRSHEGVVEGVTGTLALSAAEAFGGDPARLNPEQLVVQAVSSCQLLSFLTVATRARLDVVAYEDHAEGILSADLRPARLTRITLRPVITFGAPVAEERARHLVGVAHRECFIASSLRTEIVVEPTLRAVPGLS
jgi:organic hydroperoxide reductase OsmC/OhrA